MHVPPLFSVHTIELFCQILHCRVADVMEYIED